MARHQNNGNCPRCDEIFDTYPDFYPFLRKWFKALQEKFPDAHISDAGRGKEKQEEKYNTITGYKNDGTPIRASYAHYGQSAHNYNAAIDIFQFGLDAKGKPLTLYKKDWFNKVVGNHLSPNLNWYGLPNSVFKEMPHVEMRAWRQMRDKKEIKLVE